MSAKTASSKELTAILILAAGASTRLGQPKQQVIFRGVTLLAATVARACETGCPVYVVLGADAEANKKLLEPFAVAVVVDAHWRLGMGHSLKAGLQALLRAQPALDAVIVSVCDQPFLTTSIFQLLLSQSAPLAACQYKHAWGVPARFSNAFFSELLGLGDEEGAKKILARHQHLLAFVSFPQGDLDIDTPADLLQLKQQDEQ